MFMLTVLQVMSTVVALAVTFAVLSLVAVGLGELLDRKIDALGEALAVHGSGLDEALATDDRERWVAEQNRLITRLARVRQIRTYFP